MSRENMAEANEEDCSGDSRAADRGVSFGLESERVLDTIQELRRRISERFPTAGLNNVCAELELVCERSRERIAWIERPIWSLRMLRYLLPGLIPLVLIVAAIYGPEIEEERRMTVTELIQVLEAGINDVILISIAMFFVWTLESRVKRRRALQALHELRSIAHVIDMHQLHKDPDRILKGRRDTRSSPRNTLSAFDLRRYLDYCSEMLSLTGKVAALHLQTLDDATVVAAVNEIEGLTTGLSRKIWQKIDLLSRQVDSEAVID